MGKNLLKKLAYGDDPLTLREQAELADDLLDVYIGQLNDLLPDVDLWMGGSVLQNRLSVGCGEGVKMELLGKKKILEDIDTCCECGTKHNELIKTWRLERYIRGGKKRLKELE